MSVPTDDRLKYLRTYPEGPTYAAVTGYYSLIYGTWAPSAPRTTSSPATTPGCSSAGSPTCSPGATRRRRRRPHPGPAVQQAAMAGLGDVTGAVVALDPSTGAVLGMASTPTYDPNQPPATTRRRSARTPSSWRPPSPDLRVNQAIRENYPPGSIFKVIVRPRPGGGLQARPGDPRAGPADAAQQHPHAGELRRQQLQRRRRSAADRRADRLLQHRVRPAGHRAGRGQGPRDRRGLRPGRRGLRHPAPGGRQPRRRHRGRRRAGTDVDRPARRPHDAAAGRHAGRRRRQRRKHHGALSGRSGAGARPRRPRPHRARGVSGARRPPTSPRSSPR